jgi:predicted enzyme related to lactoylglutathione lyase
MAAAYLFPVTLMAWNAAPGHHRHGEKNSVRRQMQKTLPDESIKWNLANLPETAISTTLAVVQFRWKREFIMAKATGIGGLFFRSNDKAALSKWYETHLGVPEFWEQQAGFTVFAPFGATTDYFPADKQFMINFRVDDLDALMADLKSAGIAVETRPDEWDTPETGRFARIHDPEGNAIELWQPPA